MSPALRTSDRIASATGLTPDLDWSLAEISFKTKPELGVELVERAVGCEIEAAPLLGDQAYGCNTALRAKIDALGRPYALSIGAETTVFGPSTTFSLPEPTGNARTAPLASVARPPVQGDRRSDCRP